MQKKLMAVAVAGALAVPAVAFAQSSTVQIYGAVVVNYNMAFKQGQNKPSIDMLNSHDANVGIRGEEKLGGGLSAWFQCESTMDVTGNEAFEKGFCARNSGVGFKGAFGNIFYGQWDTPLKMIAAPARIWSTSGAFGNAEVLWNGSASNVGNGQAAVDTGVGAGGGGTQRAGWSRRQANSIFYHSPTWNGFQALGGYSTLNEATAGTVGAGGINASRKPRLWSLGAMYRNGPLYLGAGYERHTDYNAANQASVAVPVAGTLNYGGGDDSGYNLAAAYTFAKVFKLSAIYTHIEYDVAEVVAGVNSTLNTSRRGFGIYADWQVQGPHRIRAGWTTAGDTKGSAGTAGAVAATTCAGGNVAINSGWCANGGRGGTGADLWALQYAYAFSKRTELNFGYANLKNDRLARYALQTLGRPDTVGQSQHTFVLGVNHRF